MCVLLSSPIRVRYEKNWDFINLFSKWYLRRIIEKDFKNEACEVKVKQIVFLTTLMMNFVNFNPMLMMITICCFFLKKIAQFIWLIKIFDSYLTWNIFSLSYWIQALRHTLVPRPIPAWHPTFVCRRFLVSNDSLLTKEKAEGALHHLSVCIGWCNLTFQDVYRASD